MGHDTRDSLADYWLMTEQYHTPFYGKTLKRDRFFHIIRFLHFLNNDTAIDKNDPHYDRLSKATAVFDMLNDAYSKYYAPSEHLAMDEVIVLFKGRVIFRQYLPKKLNVSESKFTNYVMTGYTYDMEVNLGKDRTRVTADMTATRAIVKRLTRKVEGYGHKLYMDNFFSSPDLFDDLTKKKINCCGTVRPKRKEMPHDLIPPNKRLKCGDVHSRTRDDLTAILWKDKRNVYVLTNMYNPPPTGNFCDEDGNALKPQIIQDYNQNMRFVDKGDRMMNSYSIHRQSWKWTKNFFPLPRHDYFEQLPPPDIIGAKMTHRDFRLALVRNLIEDAGSLPRPHHPLGRPAGPDKKVSRLEVNFTNHWPVHSSRVNCRTCSPRGVQKRVQIKCKECDVGLCIGECFEAYHKKFKL
jgi:hypothetical protein